METLGVWTRVEVDPSWDWEDDGFSHWAVPKEIRLFSRGLMEDSIWHGQEVVWDDVKIAFFDAVVEPPTPPTYPPALRVWPTVTRGPVHYESSSPVFLHDATGALITTLPAGTGCLSLPCPGVCFATAGLNAHKLIKL